MLLVSVLRLWVMAQIGSSPERVCGEENLGSVVEDPSSPYHGKMLIPQVLIAQFEIISAVALQRLLAKTVLNCLHMLIKANKKCYWFTIYLALFILLHSCSITTRRDGEFARQMLIGVSSTPFIECFPLTSVETFCKPSVYRRASRWSPDNVGTLSLL